MATFAELQSDIIALTKRPDLVADTKLAIKAATLKAHQSDYYYKDLYETGVQFATADHLQQLEYRSLFPRFRSMKYLRKSDISGMEGDFFNLLTPAQVLDEYGLSKSDIYYVAGSAIQIKSSDTFQYALIGMYLNPDITEAGYSSWVAMDHPFYIVYEAAVSIFKTIGYDEQASLYSKMAAEQLQLVKTSNILAEGY